MPDAPVKGGARRPHVYGFISLEQLVLSSKDSARNTVLLTRPLVFLSRKKFIVAEKSYPRPLQKSRSSGSF